jgi:transglutaminase/protease-like cytokinesis protein 3
MILKNVRKDVVKKAYTQLPSRKTTNILKMCHLMNSVIDEFSLNDYEKVYLVYYWMGNNIEIDCSYTGKYESAVTAYTEGKSTHVGISSLFSTMVSNLGLRSNIIEGETKRTIDDPKGKKIFGELAHIWNYVIIDEKYYLFDPTFGIGGCDDNTFRPFFSELYFGTIVLIFLRIVDGNY